MMNELGRFLATVVLSAIVGGAIAITVTVFSEANNEPCCHPTDAHFATVGLSYLPRLGKAYASAWEKGAAALESGQSMASAVNLVGKEWDSGRAQLFDQMLAPEFYTIIPESQHDADITPQQRASMARAWRGFALGLGGTK